MFSRHVSLLSIRASLCSVPRIVLASHTKTCPATEAKCPPTTAKCPPTPTKEKRAACASTSKTDGSGASSKGPGLVRQEPGKVRLGFLPEEWFLFFHSKTGVSGPYLLLFLGVNYMVSKEIYIFEHEYYSGLSIAAMIIYVTTKFGKSIGAALDKDVDAYVAVWEKDRKDGIANNTQIIKDAQDAMMRAEAQKVLMDAKKENILMQLEAAYRERCMMVYRTVRGRMDYHVKLYRAEARVHQKWLIGWVLENVRKSITPEFEQKALNTAISDLLAAADRVK